MRVQESAWALGFRQWGLSGYSCDLFFEPKIAFCGVIGIVSE